MSRWIGSARLTARKCVVLVFAASVLSWLTLYSSFIVSGKRRLCFGEDLYCLLAQEQASKSPSPDRRVIIEKETVLLHQRQPEKGATKEKALPPVEAPHPPSKYTEYGMKFEKVLFDDLYKYGKPRKPWYNFPKGQVGDLRNRTLKEVLCELKKHPPFLLTDETPPFDVNPLGKYLHQDGPIMGGKTFKTCACISSSGLLKGKNLGEFIDSHDAVLRMNTAPVVNYEKDVGSKTTIRILNNSVLRWIHDKRMPASKKSWEFPDSINSTLITWEACAEKGPFTQCLTDYETEKIKKLQGESMQSFFKWRRQNMHRELYYLHPDWLWDLWELLQRYSPATIVGHVPTTGFIGFAFLMHFCEQVSVVELIPSMDYRERQPCYYFDEKESDFCFVNGYHPKKAEISMLLGLNVGDLDHVFRDGYATMPGLVNLDCES